eukprot:TRINITY_DN13307_c0_g1_i1.p1 TRINITY_DN13307_c0_g1~~TRINITY_DN13307_c0_g1_i1.p1  ORF type:complete len:266 (-),score=53.85 TRINITY_DN13307_c0_g1_i1:136-909(-)
MAPQIVSRVLSYCTFAFDFQASQCGHSLDGREKSLLKYVEKTAERGNAESVTNAIDEFTHHHWMMTLGKEKGAILDEVVKRFEPRIALELGTYCGYSAIRIASNMTRQDSKLLSIEMNTDNCLIAKKIIEIAGLSSKVEVMAGTFSDQCQDVEDFLANEQATHFELVFMDHFKDSFLQDFQLLKDRRMLGPGTAIVADCRSHPIAYDYLNYLTEHPEEMDSEDLRNPKVKFIDWLPCSLTLSVYKADLSGHNSVLAL